MDRFDEVFRSTGGFEFGPEAFDVGLDGFLRGGILKGPDAIDDARAAEHPPPVAHEEFEQGIFLGGELQAFWAIKHLEGAGVHSEVAPGAIAFRHLGASAQQGTDPGHQFLEVEGFDHVVVGSGVESGDFVGDGVAGGEHQDGGGELVAAQAAAEADAVEFRQGDVEEEQVVFPSVHTMPSEFAVFSEIYGVLAIGQGFIDHFSKLRIIFDDKDAHDGNAPLLRFNLGIVEVLK